MAGVSTSVSVTDNMSAVFQAMTASINACLGTFIDMQSATTEGLSPAQVENMTACMVDLNVAAHQFEESLNDAGDEQEQLNRHMASGVSNADSLLSKVIGIASAYASWQAVEKVIEIADGMNQTTARIDLMNDGMQTTEETMHMIYQAAEDARGSYTEMATVVAKLGNNAKDAFSGTQEIVNFAELVQKQFVIAGASTNETKNAMLQLTQALGSGVLRGDELNSIFEQAPNIIQTIADYLEVPIGQIREMASDGEITADIVKNAMFSAADEINAKFDSMPTTWEQVGQSMQNQAMITFQPILNMISQMTQMEEFQTVVSGITSGFASLSSMAMPFLNAMINGGAWIVNNWSAIEPVLVGVGAALLAYIGYQAISKALDSESLVMRAAVTVATLAHGAALVVAGLATGNMTLAQTGLNMALNACPIILIVTLIGLLIMWIYNWVQSVGGLKIAWLIVVDKVMYGWDLLKLGFSIGVHAIQNGIDNITLKFAYMKAALGSAVGNTKVAVLTGIQNMVNGAIGLINEFIAMLKKIPGVSIDAITYTATFATDAAAEEAAKQASAYADIAQQEAEAFANKQARAAADIALADAAGTAHQSRLAEIAQAQAEAFAEAQGTEVNDGTQDSLDNLADYSAVTASNTGAVADSLEVAEDNLAWMKDIAEREIIDRTVFRDIKVDMGGVQNVVNTETDLNKVTQYLVETIEEQMAVSAEGV